MATSSRLTGPQIQSHHHSPTRNPIPWILLLNGLVCIPRYPIIVTCPRQFNFLFTSSSQDLKVFPLLLTFLLFLPRLQPQHPQYLNNNLLPPNPVNPPRRLPPQRRPNSSHPTPRARYLRPHPCRRARLPKENRNLQSRARPSKW